MRLTVNKYHQGNISTDVCPHRGRDRICPVLVLSAEWGPLVQERVGSPDYVTHPRPYLAGAGGGLYPDQMILPPPPPPGMCDL